MIPDPGLRADDATEDELRAEDEARSSRTVADMASELAAERSQGRAAPPPVELTPMFPENEDERGRKRG